jgi:hypothetical protein
MDAIHNQMTKFMKFVGYIEGYNTSNDLRRYELMTRPQPSLTKLEGGSFLVFITAEFRSYGHS